MPEQEDRFANIDLTGVTIPVSFTYDLNQPTLHQEMAAYIWMRQIQSLYNGGFDYRQAEDFSVEMAVYNGLNSPENDVALLELLVGQALRIIISQYDAEIDFQREDGI